MIKILDVKMTGDIVSAKCLPENNPKRTTYIEFNIKTREIISISDPEEFWYAGHAVSKLCRIFRETGSLPETAESWWV